NAGDPPQPPAGWKGYTPKDHTFTVWIPEGAKRQVERERKNASPVVGKGGKTKIVGGAFDPEFSDPAPANGLLVGLEIGLGKFVANDVVKAVRPVFRVGDKESLGKQQGKDTSRVVKVIAKPGYAVGAITVKAGLVVDGMSVTFMKIGGDGRLDPKDAYESEWIGGKGGGRPERLAGNGAPVTGLIGKANDRGEVTGLGLMLMEK